MQKPDPSLVLLAQQGELQALDALLRASQASLHRYVGSLIPGDAATAEDVLQETFLRIVRKLRWLDEVPAGALAVDPPELDPLERERLRSAVATLPPASRAVLSLHYFSELPLDEVADALGVPLGTVKSRLAYGLGLLRRKEERTS